MITKRNPRNAVAAGLAVAFVIAGASIAVVQAADHVEAPGTQADNAADLAGVYAWERSPHIVLVMTFAGRTDPAPTYDPDVLYTFHLDRNADYVSDVDIECRFGQNSHGNWGIEAKNLPGWEAPLSGPVNANILPPVGAHWALLFAGLRDDPFFFDLDGFQATLQTGTLSFDNTRDTFAEHYVTAIVIEMMAEDATGVGESDLNVWATTARKP